MNILYPMQAKITANPVVCLNRMVTPANIPIIKSYLNLYFKKQSSFCKISIYTNIKAINKTA